MGAERRIDAIIPVHDPTRPIEQAVSSLLRSGLDAATDLRITVVCHNVDEADVRASMVDSTATSVRFISLEDGISSPAGPFTLGIERADADFVTIMGSDDQLEDGALRSWLEVADRHRLGALIPPERHDSGATVRTPPVRPWRAGRLDPLKDRMSYRTAPLGLIRRSLVSSLQLQFPGHLKNGSDQLFGLRLWFSGEPVMYGRGLPAYVVGSGAKTRVTMTVRPATEDFAAISDLIDDEWFLSRSLADRRAIVAKTVRVHLFSGALVRTGSDRWTRADRRHLAALVDSFRTAAPGYERSLSIADRRLLDALGRGDTPVARLWQLLDARRRYGHPTTLLTRDVRGLLAPDGPARFMVASRLL